jgi:hypothetical protein
MANKHFLLRQSRQLSNTLNQMEIDRSFKVQVREALSKHEQLYKGGVMLLLKFTRILFLPLVSLRNGPE